MQIHLWLGITLGVVGALLGLSGSILVYGDNLDARLNPQRYAVSGNRAALPLAEYAGRAEAASENRVRILGIRLPEREAAPVVVLARARGDAGPLQRIYLDPPTGRILDIATGGDFLAWLHSFHESLTLREYHGREIVGAVGIAMLISSLSGIYLWWPVRGTCARVFGFRQGLALHRNLHYTFGFWGSLVLALLSFTGILIAYPDAARATVAVFGAVSPSPRGLQSVESPERPIGPDDAAAVARQAYPTATVISVGFPAGPRGVYRVNLRELGDTASRSGSVVFIDPRSRTILQRTDNASRPIGDAFLLWTRTAHEGGVLGGAGRLVTFLGGLLPCLLVVTGTIMWLRQRGRRSAGKVSSVALGSKS